MLVSGSLFITGKYIMLSGFSLYISRKDNLKIHDTVKICTANTYHPKKQKA